MSTCEWQPIETAPKDGRRILISFDPDKVLITDAAVLIAAWNPDHVKGPGWYPDWRWSPHWPTHWQPLPEGVSSRQGSDAS